MTGRLTFRHTLIASCTGAGCQAIVNNLMPLLFVTFNREFAISLPSLALLISLNFGIQLTVDLLSVRMVDRIGYRAAAVAAHAFCTVGMVAMGILPYSMNDPYWGLVIAVVINAIGGGLLEVLISPIVEALPGDRKPAVMAMLHSFYCWGYVLVVLLSTLYFTLAGIERWRYLPMMWALAPLVNCFLFMKVPLRTLVEDSAAALPLKALFSKKIFWLFFLVMICSGASEQAMSQWASFFAEAGLGVSKTMGDILGPCAFAILMGATRTIYGLQGHRVAVEKVLLISGVFCVLCYLLAVFAPTPLLSLVGCALCGMAVAVMWPGTFSLASRFFPAGGTAMFALLALSGDVGCAVGPGLVGVIMNRFSLNQGLLAAILFPALLGLCMLMLTRSHKK
ncbi:MFS transporter [Spirochaetia bacterium]|nr:MFS transporter [Spirochaetia bacterium]